MNDKTKLKSALKVVISGGVLLLLGMVLHITSDSPTMSYIGGLLSGAGVVMVIFRVTTHKYLKDEWYNVKEVKDEKTNT